MHVFVYVDRLKIEEYYMCITLVSTQCVKNEV